MRATILMFLAAVGVLLGVATVACADVTVVIKTRTYAISGTSGEALVASMNRHGPHHGFLTRAIALTSYTKDWDLDLVQAEGSCRIKRAKGTLNLTYTYPRLTSVLPPVLGRRWKRFFAGVQAHEQTHGSIAKQMMKAAERSLTGLALQADAQCIKTRREARRRTDAIYDEYEARQNAFDAREHRDGGHVDRLVGALERS
ncbi:DUF922 domain-containing protein [Mesorhizobium sp. INR15]|uniref:DUF922 domain-containing protein n=1 Tax=Mesorhizobium sp. INR15 TaxID=2654248 RepID=UPI0018964013|nr:DUF922 domain-containing protein [Mesorhizobium sp. INR15]QPC94004.1 DUF922 domain-containing protein [Mesorhizobium sp. INR15]